MHDAQRQRVFLTFASGDLALTRPVTASLITGGDIALDQALTSEPFDGVRGDIIRASLRTRLGHCAAALCLYGVHTADDLWVRWALESAAELRMPLLGAALPGETAREAERLLTRLGAQIVPLERERILSAALTLGRREARPSLGATSIAQSLHLMRHPLR